MLRSVSASIALGVAVLAAAPAAAQVPDPEAASHGWLFRLEDGKARARQTGRPLMVVLRCGP